MRAGASFILGAGINDPGNAAVRRCSHSILQSPINAGAFAMIASLILVPVVSLLTPKPSDKLVDECFRCYEAPATVASKVALPDEEELEKHEKKQSKK